ncbi:hypothetical protein DFR72_1011002 [Lentzea flaviverrucosa]|uniref:Uncharacterized protein n=1 Tax=Lentzea flaviverrucosa TaxID=200379 RepID=A0A1H9FAY1_9PSEU|nr:hypothetical protein DFR72_1011002 [Lentzea flaviverrucosa]SEQ35101.1 hypothetical protein SAMN05216195_102215 [Lentzea flaviverrucosa]
MDQVLKAVGEGSQKFIVELLSSAAAKVVTGG